MVIDETVISLLSDAFEVDSEEVGEDTALHELGWGKDSEAEIQQFTLAFLSVFSGLEVGDELSGADEGLIGALHDCVTVGDIVRLAERLAEE
jgi:hypothetical protein